MVTIDLDATCTACGNLGRVVESEAGLCRICLDKTLVDDAARARTVLLDFTQRPAGRGLALDLFNLVLRAERAADQKFHSLPLPHGLFIEVGLGEFFNLRMYRRDCSPSEREWQTVVAYLPLSVQPAQAVPPRNFKYTGKDHRVRWYLEAHWPYPTT